MQSAGVERTRPLLFASRRVGQAASGVDPQGQDGEPCGASFLRVGTGEGETAVTTAFAGPAVNIDDRTELAAPIRLRYNAGLARALRDETTKHIEVMGSCDQWYRTLQRPNIE